MKYLMVLSIFINVFMGDSVYICAEDIIPEDPEDPEDRVEFDHQMAKNGLPTDRHPIDPVVVYKGRAGQPCTSKPSTYFQWDLALDETNKDSHSLVTCES